jgi:hypothetical protein
VRSIHYLCIALVVCGACKSSTDAPAPPVEDPPVVLPPESCVAPDVDAPRTLTACSTGSGNFGRWTIDDLGLVAYDYLSDERREARALFPNTENKERRDHWHAFGNDRVHAIFVNDGYVELATQDRGTTWLDKHDPEQKAYGGGFSWLDDGEARWASTFAQHPAGAVVTRRFGVGYAEITSTHRGVKLVRRLAMPAGDATVVLDDVTLENQTSSPKTLRHYEYWDVARRHIQGNFLASGSLNETVPAQLAARRDALNALFDETPSWDATTKLLRVTRVPSADGLIKLPPRDAPSDLDARPGDPYLAVLDGDASEVWLDQEAFFGDGDVALPRAVRDRTKGALGAAGNGQGQPLLFVVASDVTIPAGGRAHLRFAYGYSPMGDAPSIDPSWKSVPDVRTASADALRAELPYFASDREPWLQREMAWHGAQLFSAVGYREYWGKHVIPQGSAYLYLHGVDGVPRDLSLFAMPAVYLRPALAKEQLQLVMGLTHDADSRMSYCFHGHGALDDALIHTAPSDLDIFFLLGMTEYLEATGDASILDEEIDFHPKSATSKKSGFEHVRRAVRHLFDVVGTGEHGLVRIGTGDWSDGVVASNAGDRALAIAKGESVPNTHMAAYVLPRAAAWIRPRDAALADEMETKAKALATAAEKQWSTSFYTRAFFGDGKPFGADAIQLESQVWPLILGIDDPAHRDALVNEIATKLDAPSPAGPFLFVPPAASPEEGQVWPAIADLLPWGYARFDEARAWSTFTRTTLTAHAQAFPDTWCGIWSATDGHYGKTGSALPGHAWFSALTPMTDFPVMNANAHAMPLLALIRLAGIEPLPGGGGLRIAPHVPGRTFSLDLPLLRLDVRPTGVRGEYRPIASGTRVLEVVFDRPIAAATLDGAKVDVAPGASSVRFTLAMTAGKPVPFSVTP